MALVFTVEPLYCGHLGEMSCPHFRGKFTLRTHIWDTEKCPYYSGVLIAGVPFKKGSTVSCFTANSLIPPPPHTHTHTHTHTPPVTPGSKVLVVGTMTAEDEAALEEPSSLGLPELFVRRHLLPLLDTRGALAFLTARNIHK